MGSSFRLLDHPSDVGFEARGDTWEELLDGAVRALAAVQTGGAIPGPEDARALPAAAEDDDVESAVVGLLEECVAWLDAEDWLAVGIAGGLVVGARLGDAQREAGTHVKAITWHQLRVERVAEGWVAVVFVDL